MRASMRAFASIIICPRLVAIIVQKVLLSALKYKEPKFFISQTMLSLTKSIEKNTNIYHIKEVYYKIILYNVFN
jgi:hypothetical protein